MKEDRQWILLLTNAILTTLKKGKGQVMVLVQSLQIIQSAEEKGMGLKIRLICHVWFWPYMVRQSTKLSLYMVYQSINKCWASVPPQYHPSGPWGSLD